jgi:HSP20 family protein
MGMSRDDTFDQIERVFDQLGGVSTRAGGPAVDLVERDDEIEVTVDLPGYDTADIDVQLHDDDRLEITATRATESERAEGTVHRRERRQESVSRTVALPAPVDPEETEASHTNGVLTIRLAKRSAGEGTSIDVS